MQEATVSSKLAADWMWVLGGGRNEKGWQGFEPECLRMLFTQGAC